MSIKKFHIASESVYRLIEKESKSPNKFAQATAKILTEFLEFAKVSYFGYIQAKLIIKQQEALISQLQAEMYEAELISEQATLKDLYARYPNNPEIKAGIKEMASLNVASLKYIKNGSK